MAKASDNEISDKIQYELAYLRHENLILKTELLHILRKKSESDKFFHQSSLESALEYDESHANRIKEIHETSSKQRYFHEDDIKKSTLIMQLQVEIAAKNSKISSLELSTEKEKSLREELEISLHSNQQEKKLLEKSAEDGRQRFQQQLSEKEMELNSLKEKIDNFALDHQNEIRDLRGRITRETELHCETKRELTSIKKHYEDCILKLEEDRVEELGRVLNENQSLLQEIKRKKDETCAIGHSKSDCGIISVESEENEELHEAHKKIALLETQLSSFQDFHFLLMKEREKSSALGAKIKSFLKKSSKGDSDYLIELLMIIQGEEKYKCNNSEAKFAKEASPTNVTDDGADNSRLLIDLNGSSEEQRVRYLNRIASLEKQLLKKSREYMKKFKNFNEKKKNYGALIRKLRLRIDKYRANERKSKAVSGAVAEEHGESSLEPARLERLLRAFLRRQSKLKHLVDNLNLNPPRTQVDKWSVIINSIRSKLEELAVAQSDAYNILKSL